MQVQDKVGLKLNNMTRENLHGKADELKKALKPEMWPWFCNYMVIRRVAQEANHQNLYMQVAVCMAHDRNLISVSPPDAVPPTLGAFCTLYPTDWQLHKGAHAQAHPDKHPKGSMRGGSSTTSACCEEAYKLP